MKVKKVFTTIDTHTGGNPTRTVINGLPKLEGNTMSEKMLFMKEKYDWIRTFLMFEPRGHDVMSGALLTDPCDPEADVGVIYIETGGYLPMCGHDTIGVCTALIETGMVEVEEPYTHIKLDTPAGLVTTKVHVENGKAKEVTFCNVPAFLLKSVEVHIENIGNVQCDIAYGGNFYAITDARKLGVQLTTDNSTEIIETAIRIRDAINAAVPISHPEFSFIEGVTHVEFFCDPTDERADVKNTVIVPPGGIDRSPCGTGTSAKLATLYAYQKIAMEELFVHESIVGSLFQGKIVSTTNVGKIEAVITEITGSAWMMGMHQFLYHEEDILKDGFILIPPMEGH
ncbi:proline racemase family protein [Bacillus sp. TL12]|uniref:proline racemase family protein n=1 Tax=Bacillus sp. TL12 TaxID=2894756 RepID=UPI001F51E61F|nr:proline racemase family protein [Bacillus sp. TL12]